MNDAPTIDDLLKRDDADESAAPSDAAPQAADPTPNPTPDAVESDSTPAAGGSAPKRTEVSKLVTSASNTLDLTDVLIDMVHELVHDAKTNDAYKQGPSGLTARVGVAKLVAEVVKIGLLVQDRESLEDLTEPISRKEAYQQDMARREQLKKKWDK